MGVRWCVSHWEKLQHSVSLPTKFHAGDNHNIKSTRYNSISVIYDYFSYQT